MRCASWRRPEAHPGPSRAVAAVPRDDIIPLFGTRTRARIDENAAAVELALTDAELRRLDALFPPGVAAGARYPEGNMPQIAPAPSAVEGFRRDRGSEAERLRQPQRRLTAEELAARPCERGFRGGLDVLSLLIG